MRVDSSNFVDPTARGRDSVRITSNDAFGEVVIVLDLTHMPEGCGTWPAFWTLSRKGPWPNGGEIDIIEGEPPFTFPHRLLIPPKRRQPEHCQSCFTAHKPGLRHERGSLAGRVRHPHSSHLLSLLMSHLPDASSRPTATSKSTLIKVVVPAPPSQTLTVPPSTPRVVVGTSWRNPAPREYVSGSGLDQRAPLSLPPSRKMSASCTPTALVIQRRTFLPPRATMTVISMSIS